MYRKQITQIIKDLIYFCEKYGFAGIQLVGELKREQTINGINLKRADTYLSKLYL